ncbi:HTH-type transcriptional regulator IscR [Rubrivivax sp. A210]|uniref:Rrf2 family transcriptional regulator n=1 Tax=Rubrivivax sp. A210 TaxID=2772301 RepID=UPI00191865C4|nr:Rrf2 family transcriptional regulator [Rubrivivax sp. A210]CAD5374977.1 HTH-type transcriptional regulator IscR [Rubrivivax sp. A210]
MRMSTKGRYAVNALIDLALREPAGPVALASIAQRQQISLSYLEQLFSALRRDGVVESTRGPGGGYTLGRPADQINIGQVVRAVDDPMQEAPQETPDPSAALWRRMQLVMLDHMSTILLAELVQEQIAQGATPATPPPAPSARRPATKRLRVMAPNSVFALGRDFAA